MPREIVDINLKRSSSSGTWGFRIVGGKDEGLVCKVEKIHGLTSPASKGGLKVGDVLVSVNGVLVTLMTHAEIVQVIRNVTDENLTLGIQRGDHIIPNIKECFPVKTEQEIEQMTEADRILYYEEAMKAGLNSRLQVPYFTTVGKIRVKVPKYNSPRQLYSEDIMDEMVSGTSSIDPEKVDPSSQAFEKLKKAKSFDPKRSSVLEVLNAQMEGDLTTKFNEMGENFSVNSGFNDANTGRKI